MKKVQLVWTTKTGDDILVNELDGGHLVNIIRMLQKQVQEASPKDDLFETDLSFLDRIFSKKMSDKDKMKLEEKKFWVRALTKEARARQLQVD